jgi:hypothetical protein
MSRRRRADYKLMNIIDTTLRGKPFRLKLRIIINLLPGLRMMQFGIGI